MSDRFISISEARESRGLRLVCLRGVPSPWTEAAKGIFHAKGLACQLAAQSADDPDQALAQWAGDTSVPVVAYEGERLRTGWSEILLLAERLQPEPALIPADPAQRALMFGISHEICGEMGLGWAYRLQMIVDSLGHGGEGPFPAGIASHLAGKYGMNPAHAQQARQRVLDVLALLDARLDSGAYLLGERVSAADIYWATFANLFIPLPEAELPAVPMIRSAYSCQDRDILAAITPRLRAHQRHVYDRVLELPVVL